ncbi:spliced partial mRNA, partial [Pan troglodytes]
WSGELSSSSPGSGPWSSLSLEIPGPGAHHHCASWGPGASPKNLFLDMLCSNLWHHSSNSLQYTYSFLGRSSGADWLQREGNCFTFIFLGHFQIRIAETYFNISSPKYALEVHFF